MGNMDSLDLILTVAAFIVGIMLLTGHGDIFLKGGNSDISKKLYDEEKMAKASGVALILIGVVSAIDLFTTALALLKIALHSSTSDHYCRACVLFEIKM